MKEKHWLHINRPLLSKEKFIPGPFPIQRRYEQERRGPQVEKTSWVVKTKVLYPF